MTSDVKHTNLSLSTFTTSRATILYLTGNQYRISRQYCYRLGGVGRGVRTHGRNTRRARLRPDVVPQSLQRRLLPHST